MTAIRTKPADAPLTGRVMEVAKTATSERQNELIAADSGKTSTPMPPSVSVRQTRSTGTLDAQIQATKRESEFTPRLEVIRAVRDAKYMSSYDRAELIEQCLTLAKEAAVKDPFTASEAYAEAAALVQPAITKTLEQLHAANAKYTKPGDASRLTRAIAAANVLARGGNKAEPDRLAKAMQLIAKAGGVTGQAMCNSIAELRRQVVTTEERAWAMAGLAPGGLSTDERVAARLTADVTTPDNVAASIDIAKQAMEDGDYRFARSLLSGVVDGMPSTFTADLRDITKKALASVGQDYPDAAFTYHEVESLSELCQTLQGMARPKARAQEIALAEVAAQNSLDDADYELRHMGFRVESAKKADPADPACVAELTAAYERIAAITDGEAEQQIATAIDVFKTVPSILEAPNDVFTTAFERWEKLRARHVASADAFRSACAKGLDAAMKSWNARLAAIEAGPAEAAQQAMNKTLYSAESRLETMITVIETSASDDAVEQARAHLVTIALDYAELRANTVARMPELNAERELRNDLDEAKYYAKQATNPQQAERASTLVARIKELMNRSVQP